MPSTPQGLDPNLPMPSTDSGDSKAQPQHLDLDAEARMQADAALARMLDEEQRRDGDDDPHDDDGEEGPCKHCNDVYEKKCKHCACSVCGGKDDTDMIPYCDQCGKGYHTFCIGLGRVTSNSVHQDDTW